MNLFKSIRNSGYTFIELIIVIALVSVVGIVISKFQRDVFSFNRYFNNSLSSSNSAQKLLRPMTAEIRSASASNNGAYPIDSLGDYNFSFYSDIDNDGLKELINYTLSGTNLNKEVTKPTGNPLTYLPANKVSYVFLTDVRNQIEGIPIFTYYDETYTGGSGGVVSPSDSINAVRLVGIKIRINPDINQSQTTEVSTQVAIRNLKIQQ